ncbi:MULTISPECIES: LVIVD repeat-containing protein [unclassified Francisella]|uniref:LVIVD repeat-containing protein n=1 Tax=unclassified Francisella TaxID=2610885 RepID=UPI002E32050F|nr:MULTISPECIES: hypothetical protein [unclassified Francisella]MED7820010.1 hypothetical protein [Francisella sp. 19S2-4]MED7830830.1 hypothetical protein [Francisella sp. 19S2-10]
MKKVIFLALALIFIFNKVDAQSSLNNYTVVKIIHDNKNFNYVAISRIYKKYPNVMFLTMRGGGITSLDISDSSDPKNIKLIKGYKVPGFNGEFSLLHDKVYTQNKKVYVAATSALTNKLVIIEITDNKPKFINSIKTVKGIEGIYVKKYDNHVYAIVGGFFSNSIEVLDITNPKDIKHIKTLTKSYYLQMCPSTTKNANILFMALWGDKCGRLASFDITDPANIKELSHTCSIESAKANRVRVSGNYAFLPLEQGNTGAFSIIDISNPYNLKQVAIIKDIPNIKKSYTLSVKDNYIYIFGSKNNNLAVLKLKG